MERFKMLYLKELFNERILHNELSAIDENIDIKEQIYNFQEDLLQVDSIDKQYLLDVGWYPEFNHEGCFKIVIIKKYDWQKPIFKKEGHDLLSLKGVLMECKRLYNF